MLVLRLSFALTSLVLRLSFAVSSLELCSFFAWLRLSFAVLRLSTELSSFGRFQVQGLSGPPPPRPVQRRTTPAKSTSPTPRCSASECAAHRARSPKRQHMIRKSHEGRRTTSPRRDNVSFVTAIPRVNYIRIHVITSQEVGYCDTDEDLYDMEETGNRRTQNSHFCRDS